MKNTPSDTSRFEDLHLQLNSSLGITLPQTQFLSQRQKNTRYKENKSHILNQNQTDENSEYPKLDKPNQTQQMGFLPRMSVNPTLRNITTQQDAVRVTQSMHIDDKNSMIMGSTCQPSYEKSIFSKRNKTRGNINSKGLNVLRSGNATFIKDQTRNRNISTTQNTTAARSTMNSFFEKPPKAKA